MRVAFVGLLNPDTYYVVRRLQVEIHRLFGAKEPLKLEPHFTIKYQFETDNLSEIEKYFDVLVKNTKSIPLIIDGIKTFPKNVVFFDIAKNTDLTELHLKILQDLNQNFSVAPGEFEGADLNFHITLAYKDIDNETFIKIKEYYLHQEHKFSFTMKQIGIYLLLDPADNWFLYKIGNLTNI
jgi:2'-5' RNA ligase